jgi:putative ABC transport system ATP-binding protein
MSTSPAPPLIEFEQVSKTYRSRDGVVSALADLSLTIQQGQYVAVCGPSGCGKSTLLSLVGGLAVPTSGRVTVGDLAMSSASAADRARFRAQHIGFVFQMFHLLPYLSVLDNVLVAAARPGCAETIDHARQLVAQFGLLPRCSHRPAQLSIGERQRVAMARALLNRPTILLADEPTGNLDPQNSEIVLARVDDFHRSGGTVLLVTHEAAAAARAQRTVRLDQGRLVDHASGAAPLGAVTAATGAR